MPLLGLVVLAAVVVGVFFTNQKLDAGQLAKAERQADQQYQDQVRWSEQERRRLRAGQGAPARRPTAATPTTAVGDLGRPAADQIRGRSGSCPHRSTSGTTFDATLHRRFAAILGAVRVPRRRVLRRRRVEHRRHDEPAALAAETAHRPGHQAGRAAHRHPGGDAARRGALVRRVLADRHVPGQHREDDLRGLAVVRPDRAARRGAGAGAHRASGSRWPRWAGTPRWRSAAWSR